MNQKSSPTHSTLWTAANVLMLLVFLFAVAVQYNDPDPWRWSAIYGLAAAACVLEVLRKNLWLLPAGIAAAGLAWALSMAPEVVGRVPLGTLFQEFEMRDAGVEQAREVGGLLIVACWMAVLAWTARGRRVRSIPSTPTSAAATRR